MHRTCARLDLRFSLSSTAFFLVTLTGVEIAKTVTSFLTPVSPSEDTGWHNGPSFCSWSTWHGRCLFFPFGSDVDTHLKWVLASFPSSSMPRTSAVVLVFLWMDKKSLVSRRWLFSTRCISRGEIDGLILSRVLCLLFCGPVPLETPWVHLADTWE